MTVGGKLIQPYHISPTGFAGLYAWYEPLDSFTITKDANNFVSECRDKSGNNLHLTQTVASKQPIANSEGLLFDNVNDGMINEDFTLTQPFTSISVWKITATRAVAQFCFSNRIGGATEQVILDYFNTNQNIRMYAGAQANAYLKTGGNLDFIINSVVWNGTSSEIYENNVSKGTVSPGTNPITGLTLGNFFDYSRPLHGTIAEQLFYNRVLNPEEINQLVEYLNSKHNVY